MNRSMGLAVAGALLASVIALPPQATAGPADGTLTVRLVRDINGNGSYEPALELGVAGIPVTVTDPAGGTATGTTGPDGTVKVDLGTVASGAYRVEAAIPAEMPYLKPAPAGNGLSSLTEFVNVANGANVTLTMGVWNPSDYCQANPVLVTGCQRNSVNPGASSAARSLVSSRSPPARPTRRPLHWHPKARRAQCSGSRIASRTSESSRVRSPNGSPDTGLADLARST